MSYAAAEGITLYYERSGRGTPVLFLSGTGWSGEYWKLYQVPHFSASFDVVTFDYRGCGRSERPDGHYATRQFAADAAALLEANGIDEPVHLVGHSMGGRVAQWLALDRPELVRSLVLVASGAGMLGTGNVGRGISPEEVVAFMTHGWPEVTMMEERGPLMFHAPDPALVERFVGCHRGQFGTDALSFLRHMVARYEHQTVERLPEITQPCLVIVGECDTHPTNGRPGHLETSRYLAENLPNAELALIPEAAHAVQIEKPDEFNAVVVDYLQRH